MKRKGCKNSLDRLKTGCLFFMLLLAAGCAESVPEETEFALGTVCSVTLYNRGSRKVYDAVFSRVREIENLMSITVSGTDVDRINQNAGVAPVRVRPEVLGVVETALYYAELSGGGFDPTIGPLVRLWDIGAEEPRLPGSEAVLEGLGLIGWRDVAVDPKAETVLLRRPGMALDLGAIAKGYAADEGARIIREARIPGGIIDFGGNIVAIGEKPGGKPWRIGVQNPAEPRGTYIGVLEVRNKSVVTSGVYERYMEIAGKRYHHILSTETGYPADSGLLSVTIIADTSTDADALSTAVFVLGYEKGAALIESLDATEAVFILKDGSIRLTAGAAALFTLKK